MNVRKCLFCDKFRCMFPVCLISWGFFFKKLYDSGADLGFSRGGGGRIFKKFSKILTTFFFLGRPNWFFELSQSTVLPLFWQSFLRRRQIFEKFWQKNSIFFGARSPSKLVYIGAKGAFRKILGSVGQKGISEKVSKGGPFGSAGGRIPEVGRPPPPP